MNWSEDETKRILVAAKKQSLRIEALTKLEILKARSPEKYRRLMYLEARKRGLLPRADRTIETNGR